VVEIETEDRLGLLYIISQTLAELGLDISAARIATERGAAIDSFYVSDADGVKVIGPERREHIASRLRTAIGGLETVI
jgi:[protein-PII] uridylyltransferase